MTNLVLRVNGLSKTFTLHTQNGVTIPVFENVDLDVQEGECVVLRGPSGSGKSTLLRSLYANYKPSTGKIRVRHDEAWIDLVTAIPQNVLSVRARTIGYVSQFLRVIPRVPTLDVVAHSVLGDGIDIEMARRRARDVLERLNLPRRLWSVPPATFSGGEQQRVNIARCFVRHYPLLLLDEPTASLDADNSAVVIELIQEALARNTAIVAIVHDESVREAIATREFDVTRFKPASWR